MLPGWEINISDLFSLENHKGDYCYDFGDGWQHDIILEKILPCETGVIYPRCVDGKRACPPEDCGGIGGYAEFLEAIGDPANELHEDMLDWVGGSFDPEDFNPSEVKFDDRLSALRLRLDNISNLPLNCVFLKTRGSQCTGCHSLQIYSSHRCEVDGSDLNLDANDGNQSGMAYELFVTLLNK